MGVQRCCHSEKKKKSSLTLYWRNDTRRRVLAIFDSLSLYLTFFTLSLPPPLFPTSHFTSSLCFNWFRLFFFTFCVMLVCLLCHIMNLLFTITTAHTETSICVSLLLLFEWGKDEALDDVLMRDHRGEEVNLYYKPGMKGKKVKTSCTHLKEHWIQWAKPRKKHLLHSLSLPPPSSPFLTIPTLTFFCQERIGPEKHT